MESSRIGIHTRNGKEKAGKAESQDLQMPSRGSRQNRSKSKAKKGHPGRQHKIEEKT